MLLRVAFLSFSFGFLAISLGVVPAADADDIDSIIDDLIAFKLRTAVGAQNDKPATSPIRRSTARISTETFKAEVLSQHHEAGVFETTTLYVPRLGGVSYQVTVVKADNESTAKNNARLRDLARFDITDKEDLAGMVLRSAADTELLHVLEVSASAYLRIQPSRPVRKSQVREFVGILPMKELLKAN